MNDFQQKLWDDLMKLVSENESFYFVDQKLEVNLRTFRIFNYRIASWTEFQLPNALNCRGTMFEITEDGKPLRLASLSMHKFFNLGEGNVQPDLSLLEGVELKVDGSLISTYIVDGELFLKSKGSLFSEQALDAMKWLNQPENATFKTLLFNSTMNNYTVNMEWLSPNNRIVIGYEIPHLKVLNIRSNADGNYVRRELTPSLQPYWIDVIDVSDPVKFVASIPDVKGIEGYVLKFSDGLWIKCKGSQYVTLHTLASNLRIPRHLYETVINECVDDVIGLFAHDLIMINKITQMQNHVAKQYNNVIVKVEQFYDQNKLLDRKTYAIKCKQELSQVLFGLCMSRYLGKEVKYKQFMLKNYELFRLPESVEIESFESDLE